MNSQRLPSAIGNGTCTFGLKRGERWLCIGHAGKPVVLLEIEKIGMTSHVPTWKSSSEEDLHPETWSANL